jgi:hypothetical protein
LRPSFTPRAFPLAPLGGARPDQVFLELGQPAQHGQHQAIVRGRRVGPGVGEGTEAGFLAGDRRENAQGGTGRAGEAVEPCHHRHVAVGELVEQAAKLRPVGLVALRHLAEHLFRPIPAQRRDLCRDALASCRYPRIAANHGFFPHRNCAPEKPFVFKAEIWCPR